jgi:hypothetical protein
MNECDTAGINVRSIGSSLVVMFAAKLFVENGCASVQEGYQGGLSAVCVLDEVLGIVFISEENDAISMKTRHTGRTLFDTHVTFGGKVTSVTSERFDKLESSFVVFLLHN